MSQLLQVPPKPAAYGQCDSYFVESADDGLFARRAEARNKERLMHRQTQREMAIELSAETARLYRKDALAHMLHMETETMPDVNSIDIQQEVQWFMRPYLLDFLVEAHAAFQLLPETLYLAINILDRYCSKRVVYKKHYQLVGCAALLIAAKYGDRKDRVPLIRELKSMCCSLYEEMMFTQMEWHVLVTLDWVIGHPTADSFLQLVMCEGPYDRELEHMTWFICEMALYHRDFLSTPPSILARSALTLARCILDRPVPEQTSWCNCYDSTTVVNLSHKLTDASEVLKKKYATGEHSFASGIVTGWLERQAQVSAAAAALDPITPTVADTPIDLDNTMIDAASATPVTPQKHAPGQVSACHYATPPITPDHVAQQYMDQNFADSKHLAVPQNSYMPLPTPPSSVYPSQYSNAQFIDSAQQQYYHGP